MLSVLCTVSGFYFGSKGEGEDLSSPFSKKATNLFAATSSRTDAASARRRAWEGRAARPLGGRRRSTTVARRFGVVRAHGTLWPAAAPRAQRPGGARRRPDATRCPRAPAPGAGPAPAGACGDRGAAGRRCGCARGRAGSRRRGRARPQHPRAPPTRRSTQLSASPSTRRLRWRRGRRPAPRLPSPDAVVVQKQLDEVAGRERAIHSTAASPRPPARARRRAGGRPGGRRGRRPAPTARRRRRSARPAPRPAPGAGVRASTRTASGHSPAARTAPRRGEGLGASRPSTRHSSRSVRQPPSAAARSVSTGAATTTTVRSAEFRAEVQPKSTAARPAGGRPPWRRRAAPRARPPRDGLAPEAAPRGGRAAVVGR